MSRKKSKYVSNELIDEAVTNIRADKLMINGHICEISNIISQDTTGDKYRELGNTLVKCLEDGQKVNDQFIKVIAALQRNEEYDLAIQEEEEEEDFDSLLDRVKEDGEEKTE